MSVDLNKYRDRLRQTDTRSCRGRIVRVAGLTVESHGPPVGVGELCQIHVADGRRVSAEVIGFHGVNRVLMPLEPIEGIAPDDAVTVRSAPRSLPVGPELLGRVIDALGRPLDGAGPLGGRQRRSLDVPPPPPMSRPRITEPLLFGLRAFDGLLTCGKGQRIGIFSGSGVGKSTLLGEIARCSSSDVNVLALVGERGREVRHFLEESLGPEGLARSVVVIATSDASPIQRVKAAFTATSIAEYFRDQGKDVLFMMDSLTRFATAQREIGLAAGEPPTTKGYCPSVFSVLPKFTERLGRAEVGSITGVLTILVEGDDMDDPVADTARSLLDGHCVLSRKLAEQGHYPAVDILQSVSRLMDRVVDDEHVLAAQRFRAIYATYRNAEDLINIGAFSPGSNRRIDKAVSLIDRVSEFLRQPRGEPAAYDAMIAQLKDITESWEFLMPTDSPEATNVAPPEGGGA
ncbi:MAG: FliI/YscN family ATPase [Phycisphaerae bacterium]|nr:FliI/YscN family ATPase [Phycisphaerae bacterium]